MRFLLLALESVLLYLSLPLLIAWGVLPKIAVLPLLWGAALYAFIILRRARSPLLQCRIDRKTLLPILKRFMLLAAVMALFVVCCYPQMLFSLPQRHPGLWLAVLLLYPLLSVPAQEIVFRAFFAYRFEKPIQDPRLLITLNAFFFAYAHLLYGNAIALLFSFLGGFMFMSTFLKTRSVATSSIEHALYGDLVFTLGIGRFFYHAG